MVYVDRNGQVSEGGKLSWRRPVDSFKEILGVLILFFMSMFGPIVQLFAPSGSTSSSPSSFRGSAGSSSGGNGSNRGNRRGFGTMSDIRPPPMPFGGCSGGSCGM